MARKLRVQYPGAIYHPPSPKAMAGQALWTRRYARSEWQQSAEQKAKRILAEELQGRGWDLEELKRRRKGDAEKVQIVCRLRAQTTMTVA